MSFLSDTELAERVDEENKARVGAPGTHPQFDRLVRTIWRLRQEDGCPWDRAQTHKTITSNMIEEAYEAVEAINENSSEHLREELGDVLEQVLLHAQIEADEGGFTIDDVLREFNEKIVRRHPHVFGDAARAGDAEQALESWDEVKKLERARKGTPEQKPGLLDSVPKSLPALMQAQKISKRAVKEGFEWDSEEEIWEQFAQEREEFLAEEPGSPERAEEFGDMLFSLVNIARWEGIDAEEALSVSNEKFRRRWKQMEKYAQDAHKSLGDYSTEELNGLWNRAKGEKS